MKIRTVGDMKKFMSQFKSDDMPFLICMYEQDPFQQVEGFSETNEPGYPNYPMLVVDGVL